MATVAMTASAGKRRFLIDDPVLIDDQDPTGVRRCASFPLRCGHQSRCADLFRRVAQDRSVSPRQSWRCSSGSVMMQQIRERDVKLYVRLHPHKAKIIIGSKP
jgi:hypothetical protein